MAALSLSAIIGGEMDLKDSVAAVSKIHEMAAGSIFLSCALIIFLLFLLFSSLAKLFDVCIKVAAAVKGGFVALNDVIRGGETYREHIQRRKQFLSVLSSDLAAIGKAEAWNDQNFTDLEAEVQIEGGYFASIFDRMRQHRSFGQRREKSLIGAIDGSAERCMLLTGDPGAGKSVALRHLAVQMIERAKKSRKMFEPIPLYVNLRELSPEGAVDSSSIKKFVIDNVRRGDADTAEYLNSNWTKLNEMGGWFFLFDSFDEIPEVLHAANEDVQIDKFGKAIQQFMDGFGVCRGVMASREFKSPKALAWPRLKILPLNESLQEELIENTFLSKDQKRIALRSLSTSHTATYRNPLFLTLLCRYVREHNAGPKNEHQLLYRHVDSLCERDEDYVVSRWGLSPEMMKIGAEELARIFALAPEIGLSPTIEEVSSLSGGSEFLCGRVEQVIEALTYVKVGRMDVASASRRERRFSFSHRRYHEAIFAKFLSENCSAIDPVDMLCNPRWREYVVAMLQTSSPEKSESLIKVAARLVGSHSSTVRLHEERVSGVASKTYAWRDDVLLHLLKLMVDVKTFNPSSVWQPAERVVEQFFAPLWARGDLFDRMMIIRYGGAGSADAHSRRVEYARESGVSALHEEAIASCQFATSPSIDVADWIRARVARKIVTSSRNLDALKWEALAAQLPSAYEASICVERSKSLRRHHKYARALMFPFYYAQRFTFSLNRKISEEVNAYQKFRFGMMAVNMIPIFAIAGLLLPAGTVIVPGYLRIALAALMFLCVVNLVLTIARLENLSLPRRIAYRDVTRTFKVDYKLPLLAFLASAILVGLLSLPGFAVLWVARKFDLWSSLKDVEIAVSGSIVVIFFIGLALLLILKKLERSDVDQARKILNSRKSLSSAVRSAIPLGAVADTCAVAIENPATSDFDIRRAVTLLSIVLLHRNNVSRRTSFADELDSARGLSHLLAECGRRSSLAATQR